MAASTTHTRLRRVIAGKDTFPTAFAPPVVHAPASYVPHTVRVLNAVRGMRADRKRATVQTVASAAVKSAVQYARYGLHVHMPAFAPRDAGTGELVAPRPAAASSGDHLAASEHVRRVLGDAPTVDAIVALTGYANAAELAAVARGEGDTAPIGDLARAIRGDGPRVQWQTGRWLAGIMAAMVEATRHEAGIIPDPRA